MAHLDAYASQPNYWRHLAPIVRALGLRAYHPMGYNCDWGEPLRRTTDVAPLVLVASEIDARRFQDRRVIYVEHGAGQTYVDGADGGTGYAGGPRLGHCALFLSPNEHAAERWRSAYQDTPVAVVGCPALDEIERGPGWVVHVTSHWDCGVCPETAPALSHFTAVLPALRWSLSGLGLTLVGHAHPRARRRQERFWREQGMEFEPDPDVVLSTTRCLIADNTSLLYEAAALGVPCVVLNSPSYRRDVEHGLRFWTHVPGIQVDDPRCLTESVTFALSHPTGEHALRERAARRAYAHPPGEATKLAVEAIRSLAI